MKIDTISDIIFTVSHPQYDLKSCSIPKHYISKCKLDLIEIERRYISQYYIPKSLVNASLKNHKHFFNLEHYIDYGSTF